MRRAPLTRALTVLVALVAILGLTNSTAHASDATIGLPSISLDFSASPGVNGSQEWCASGQAAADAIAPTWTVIFTGTRAVGLPYRSGPHVFTLSTMGVCGVLSKDGALAGTMKVTVTYVGAIGSTPLTTGAASAWLLDGDYFKDWHN